MLTPIKQQYPDDIDLEVIELCDAINCIPGIRTHESCSGHGKKPVDIYIEPTSQKNLWLGLFFLGRCASDRYWRYGREWTLSIDVEDCKRPEGPPLSLRLTGTSVGEQSYTEASSLATSVVHHLNHKNFIKLYDIDLSKFDLEGELCGDDWWTQISNL